MTTKTIDCIGCGESVPYGRLSCPACGALLASVGGRSAGAPQTVAVPVALARPVAAPGPEAGPELVVVSEPVAEPESLLLPDDHVLPPTAWDPLDEPIPVLAGRPYRLSFADEPPDLSEPPLLTPEPSAYRPSGLTLSGAGAVAAGAGWSPSSAATATATTASPATTRSRAAAARSRIGPVDPARFAEIAGWFVVVGATMTVLGFLLPWSVVVIGARSVGGYFDTWGLASPTHVVVLAATMLVLALGIVRTSVPVWIRSGLLPLALGSLLIGLAWPYQVGPLGADVGILVIALGGLALVIGGVVATWATRHVEVDPVV